MTLRENVAKAIHDDWNESDDWKRAGDTVRLRFIRDADAALSALRQWLADEKLVVVPRDATQEMTGAVLDPGAPRSEIMKTYAAMISAAPDALETKP